MMTEVKVGGIYRYLSGVSEVVWEVRVDAVTTDHVFYTYDSRHPVGLWEAGERGQREIDDFKKWYEPVYTIEGFEV